MIERRVVCDTCGQQQGLFHKDCPGQWVTQQRTVSEWKPLAAGGPVTKFPDPSLLPIWSTGSNPFASLACAVVGHRVVCHLSKPYCDRCLKVTPHDH